MIENEKFREKKLYYCTIREYKKLNQGSDIRDKDIKRT